MLLIVALVAAGATAADSAASLDPIARSIGGEFQCYGPDVEKKTCQSIASYRRTGPGTYINTALLPLGDNVTLETRSPVIIKEGAVCGVITRQQTLAGTLRAGNQVIRAEAAKPLLERVADAVAPFFDKEICTRYEQSGPDFTAKASIDGVSRPERDVTVKWITPTDGYTVVAPNQEHRTKILAASPKLEAEWMETAKCGMANGGYGFSWADTPFGIYILAVAPGSRAEAAGLSRGQQVLEVNGKSTLGMSRSQFNALIHSKPAAGFDLRIHGGSGVRLPPLKPRQT